MDHRQENQNVPPTPSPPDSAGRWRLQFTLRQVLLAVGLVSVLCALTRIVGPLPVLLIVAVISIVLVALSIRRRSLIGASAGVVTGIASISLLIAGSTVAVGSGRSLQSLAVEVIDSRTRAVLAGATVRIRDAWDGSSYHNGVLLTPIPPGEKGTSAVAHFRGIAVLNWKFPSGFKEGLFMHEHNLYILDTLWLQVEAPGHAPTVIKLNDLLGRKYEFERLPLPQLRIEVP